MLKYNFKQGIAVTEENGAPIKEFNVQMYLNEAGIDEPTIIKMLEMFSRQFTNLISETHFPTEADWEFDKLNDELNSFNENGKGWK
jgi:hypothetical protein